MIQPQKSNSTATAVEVDDFSYGLSGGQPVTDSAQVSQVETPEVEPVVDIGPQTEEQAAASADSTAIDTFETPLKIEPEVDPEVVQAHYDSLDTESKRRYDVIKELAPKVKAAAKETGLNPAFILSQMMQESGYAKSGLTSDDHNWGGIKDHHPEQGEEGKDWNKWFTNEDFSVEEYGSTAGALRAAKQYLAKEKAAGFDGIGTTTSRGKRYRNSMYVDPATGTVIARLQQPFKKFKDDDEGLQRQLGFYDEEKNPRYAKAGIYDTEDPYEQLQAARDAGYATSDSYVNDISSIIDSVTKEGGKYYNAYGATAGWQGSGKKKKPAIDFDDASLQLAWQSSREITPNVLALGDTPQANQMGESKYDTGLSVPAFLNIEETRAQRQTLGDKFANGMLKFVGKTATNVVGGIVGTVYGLGAAIGTLDKGAFFDNDFAHLLDDTNEWMDEKLPHYYTQAEMEEENFLKKVSSANFLFDSTLNGFSFLAGAVLTEVAATMLTAGAGSAFAAAGIAARAARVLKRFDRTKRMANLASGMSKVASRKASWEALKVGRQLLTGASYESGVEARAHQDEMYSALKNDWIKSNPGKVMTEDEELQMKKQARDSANAVFLGNMALVGGSNMLMLGKLYGPGITLRKTIGNKLGRLAPTSRTIGKTASGKAVGKYASLGKVANFAGIGEKTQATIGKALGRTQAVFGTAIYEGAVEEAGQSVLGTAMLDYGMMKYSSEAKEAQADILSSFAYGFSNTYKGTEGQTEIALGAALSLIGMGAGSGARGRYKARKDTESVQDKIASNYDAYKDMATSLKGTSKFLHDSHELQRLMDKAEASGNIAEYKDLKAAQFFGYVKSRKDAGYYEDIAEDAEAIRDMSNEEFVEFFGYDQSEFADDAEISARKEKVADDAISSAKKIKDALDTADRVLGSFGDDNDAFYTDEKLIQLRDTLAYQLATAEDTDTRSESLMDRLAKLSGGKISGASATELSSITMPTLNPETGEMEDSEVNLNDFTSATLPKQAEYVVKKLEEYNSTLAEDRKLGENDPEKLSTKEKEVLEGKIETLKAQYEGLESLYGASKVFSIKDLDKLTAEEAGFLSTVTQSLGELLEEDPVQYAKNIDEMVEILQDLRHLRARRQTALNTYNTLFTEGGRQEYFQEIERFVEEENTEAAFKRLDDTNVPEDIKQMFAAYGANADLHFVRPVNVEEYEAKPFLAGEKGEFKAAKHFILRFTEEGDLYSVDDTLKVEFTDEGKIKLVGVESDKTVAANLILAKVVTDKQKEAAETIKAIDLARSNKKAEITALKKEIEDAYTQMFEAMEYTGRFTKRDFKEKGFRYVDKETNAIKKTADIKDAWDTARLTIDVAEDLITLYEQELVELDAKAEYLGDLVAVYYNPRTQEFDTNLETLYGQAQVDRNLALQDLGADRGILEDREKAREFANLFVTDLKDYTDKLAKEVGGLRTSLEYLEDYKDVLESVMIDRLKSTGLSANRYERANTLNEMFADAVNSAEEFIMSEEGREEYLEIPSKNSEVGTMRTQLDILKELKNYREYRRYMKQHPGFFLELGEFLDPLDVVEAALEDMRFLRSEIKLTKEQIVDVNERLGAIQEQQTVEEGVRDRAQAILESIQFEEAYESIVEALSQIEAEVLNKLITAEEKTEGANIKDGPTQIKGVGPISDHAHAGEGEFEDASSDGFHGNTFYRSYLETGFNRTAGNSKASRKVRNEYGHKEEVDGKLAWVANENNTPEQNKLFKSAVAELRFERHVSKYMNYKNHVLVPVHSGNIPKGLEEELEDIFFEDERTVDGAHIRMVLYKKEGGKIEPVYENSKTRKGLIFTTLMLPTSTVTHPKTKEVLPRFIQNPNNVLSDFELKLEQREKDHRALREDILNDVPLQLNITGSNTGYINTQKGARHSIKGRLIHKDAQFDGQNIVIATNVVDPITGESVISGIDRNFKVRAGFAYYKRNGNLFPLKMRNLDDLEAANVVKLLQRRESEIDVLTATGTKRGAAFKEADDVLKKEGVSSTISELIGNYIYEGKLTKAQAAFGEPFQFYFDTKLKGYRYGTEGLITSKQLREGDVEAVGKLTDFLLTKTYQVNNKLLLEAKPKKGAKSTSKKVDASRKFELVVLGDDLMVDKDKSKIGKDKIASYERHLLAGDNPILGTAVIADSPTDTQVNHKHLRFSTAPAAKQTAPVRPEVVHTVTPPSGMEYTTTQKESISDAINLVAAIENGGTIVMENLLGVETTVEATLKNINMKVGFIGSEASKAWTSKEQALEDIKRDLEDYKNNTYLNREVYASGSFLNVASFEGLVSNREGLRLLGADEVLVNGVVQPKTQDAPETVEVENNDEAKSEAVEEVVDMQDLLNAAKEAEGTGEFDDNAFEALSLSKATTAAEADKLRATPEEAAKETALLKVMYPNMDITRVAGFIKTKDGYAQGRVAKYGEMMLSDLAEYGTGYHEAFHQTSLFMLDKAERDELYTEARKNTGKVRTFAGELKPFEALTDREAEEYLASEFRLWVITDGKHKIGSTRVKSIFQKIADILKLILGKVGLLSDEVDPNFEKTLDVFTKIRQGHFAEATPKSLKVQEPYNSLVVDGKPVITIGNLSALQTTGVVRSFHSIFVDEMFFNSNSPYILSDLSKMADPTFKFEFTKAAAKAYGRSVIKISGQLDYLIKNSKGKTQVDAIKIKNQLKNNSNKWVDLVNLHREYMTSIGAGSIVTYDDIAEDEYARVKDSASNMVDAMEQSATAGADAAIKVLISSLNSGTLNASGLEDIVHFNDSMNYLQEKLVGTLGFEAQVEVLKKEALTKPWIGSLLDKLQSKGDLGMAGFDYAEVKLRMMFTQQFAKTKNDFLLYMVNSDGEIYSVDTNKQRLNRTITNPWRANMMAMLGAKTSVITQNNAGKAIVDVNKKIDFGRGRPASIKEMFKSKDLPVGELALKFFSQLGIEFTNPGAMTSDKIEEGQTEPNGQILNSTAAWVIKELVGKSLGDGLGADLFSSENVDAQTRLGNLLKIESANNDTVVELQHFNAENKVVYGITLNTYLSLMLDATSQDKYLNPDINLFSKNSQWAESLRNGDNMQIVVLEGMKIDDIGERGTKNSKLTGADQRSMDVNATLQGVAPFLRAADQGVEYGLVVPGPIARNIVDEREALLGYFEDEIRTAAALNTKGEGAEFKRYRDGGKSLRIFKDIVLKYSTGILKADIENALKGAISYEKLIDKHEEAIFTLIAKHLNTKASETVDMFIKHRLVDKNSDGTYSVNGISIQTVQKILHTTDTTFSKESIRKVAEVFTLNDFKNSMEQLKMFMGDPSFYKALFKRTKGAVGTGKVTSTDPILNDWLDSAETPFREDGKEANGYENVHTYRDPIAQSKMFEEYHKHIGDNANAYKYIEEADAQAYSSLGAYRELMIRIGDWTDLQEGLYEKALAWTPGSPRLSANELANFPVLKPQYFGPQVTNGVMAPFFMKFSLAPIFPQMLQREGKPTLLNSLYENMIATQTGIAIMESGVKAGSKVDSTGSATPFFNKEGTINPINPDLNTVIDYKFMKIQVDINPKAKSKVTAGTQERSLVFSNMFEGGIPIDFMRNTKISQEARRDSWDGLTEKEKVMNSRKYELLTKSNTLLNAFTKNAKEALLEEFDLEQADDGSYSLKTGDFTKFVKVLQNELARRSMPRNMAQGLEYILANAKSGAVLDLLVNKDRMESMLFSLLSNRVVRHKFKGDMKIQVSSSGMQVTSRTMHQDGKEYKALTGDANFGELKMYSKEDTNNPGSKTLGMDILLPHSFKEFIGQDLQVRKDGIYNQKGDKVGGSELLQLIGFRTPTEDLYSIDFINVAGFLPKEMGSAVVIPSELVVKAGGDFDIDKMTLYMPSYKMEKGVMVKESRINGGTNLDGTVTEAALTKYYNAKYLGILNFAASLEKAIQDLATKKLEADAAVNNFISVVFGMDSTDSVYAEAELEVLKSRFNAMGDLSEEVKVSIIKKEYSKLLAKVDSIPTMDEFRKANSNKTPLDLESNGALQNEIMDIHREILSSPDNYAAIITPLTLQDIEDNALHIRSLKGEVDDVSSLGWAEMIGFKNRSQLKEDFWSAAIGVGIAARNVTHQVKSQIANLIVSPATLVEQWGEEHLVGVHFEGFDTAKGAPISLSSIYDKAGNKISKTLAQFVSGFIDVVNDPYIFTLNIDSTTANAWFYLIRAGVPLRAASLFFNQPIIDTVLDSISTNRSKFLTAAGKQMSLTDIVSATRQMYRSQMTVVEGYVSVSNPVKKGVEMFTEQQLEEMVGFTDGEGLTDAQLMNQLQVLDDLIMYMGIGNELNLAVSASSQDTVSPKNRHEARIQNAEFAHVVQKNMFTNFGKLFENSFLKEFKAVSQDSEFMFADMFLTDSGLTTATNALNRVHSIFTNPELRVSKLDRVRAMKAADNDFIVMLLQTMEIDGKILADRGEELMRGPQSLPNRIARLKKKGYDNPWIEALTPLISVDRGGALATTDAMQLVVQSLDTYTQDMLLDAFEELKIAAPRLATDVLDFAILQSGYSQSSVSFTSVLPATLLAERALKVFNKYNNSTGHITAGFFDKFFKNNWNNAAIVPAVKANSILMPSVSEHSNAAQYPYVVIVTPSVSKSVAKEMRRSGLKVPIQKVLFKKTGLSAPTATGVRFVRYAEASKFGNGSHYKEYRPGVESSMIEQNNDRSLAETVRSAQTAVGLPKEITAKMQDFILKGTKTAVSVPSKALLKSGTYKSGRSTFSLELASTNLKVGELKGLAAKTRFASKEGFTTWDKLVSAIDGGYSSIPKIWLQGKAGVKVFKVSNVVRGEDFADAGAARLNTVAFTGPRLKGMDGADLKGDLYKAVESEMKEVIEELILDGKTDFVIGGAEGVDIMAGRILLDLQNKEYRSINVHLVIPYKGYESSVHNADDAEWLKSHLSSRYSVLRKYGNTITFAHNGSVKDWKDAADKNHARNRAMINKAETVVGVWSKGQKGGTGNAVEYTKSLNRTLRQIDLEELRERVQIAKRDEQESQNCN